MSKASMALLLALTIVRGGDIGPGSGRRGNPGKGRKPMTKILVLHYSMYGHVETLAHAVAEGARSVEGAEVAIKRVPN